MADEPRTYANTACPYCSVELDPLPKAKKRCVGCRDVCRCDYLPVV